MRQMALICEQWEMELDRRRDEDSRWFLDWVLASPREASRHVTGGFLAYRSLKDIGPVRGALELFGGMGCQSLIIRHLFGPDTHHVVENHPMAVEHLRKTLEPAASVALGDAFATEIPADTDIVGFDCGDLTVHRANAGPHRELLERTFAARPSIVMMSDVAGARLQLNRDRYGAILGGAPTETYEDYLRRYGWWLREEFGYVPARTYFQQWSALLALVPRGKRDRPGAVRAMPERPRGIVLA